MMHLNNEPNELDASVIESLAPGDVTKLKPDVLEHLPDCRIFESKRAKVCSCGAFKADERTSVTTAGRRLPCGSIMRRIERF